MTGDEPARAIAHVGISVPDLEAAVDWYCAVFGMEALTGVEEVDVADGGAIAVQCEDMFGPRFGRLRSAQLAAVGGGAVELFQFVEPAYEPPDVDFPYWRGGIFHLAIVARDVERLVAAIEARGGRRRSRVEAPFEDRPVRACYCEDPWGTVIEVISHSTERIFSNVRSL